MPAGLGLGLALFVSVPLFWLGLRLIRGGKNSDAQPAPIVPPGFSQPSGVDLAGAAAPPKASARGWKLWAGLALLLGGGVVALFIASGLAMMRAEKAWRADLPGLGKAPAREVPPGQPNAADLYLEAGKSLPPDIPKSSPRLRDAIAKPWADPDGALEKWLDDTRASLESARKAGTLPFCDFLPADVRRVNVTTSTPEIGRMHALGLFLLLSARRNEANGQPAAALADVAAALTLAERLHEQKTPLLLFQLIADGIQDAAFAPAASLLANPAVPPAIYVGFRDALVHASPAGAALGRAIALDRSLYEDANSRYLDRLLWWLPNGVRQGLIEDYREAERSLAELAVAASERNDPAGYERRRAELQAKHPPGRGKLAESVGHCIQRRAEFGDCMLTQAPPGALDYGKLIARSQLADAKLQLLFAAAGVRLRELQAAAPPAKLAELVPEHLPRLPYDPFDGGKAPRYTADGAGWFVYSLGADRKDDQGRAAPPPSDDADWRKPDGGDLVLAALRWVPPKAPRKPRRAG